MRLGHCWDRAGQIADCVTGVTSPPPAATSTSAARWTGRCGSAPRTAVAGVVPLGIGSFWRHTLRCLSGCLSTGFRPQNFTRPRQAFETFLGCQVFLGCAVGQQCVSKWHMAHGHLVTVGSIQTAAQNKKRVHVACEPLTTASRPILRNRAGPPEDRPMRSSSSRSPSLRASLMSSTS